MQKLTELGVDRIVLVDAAARRSCGGTTTEVAPALDRLATRRARGRRAVAAGPAAGGRRSGAPRPSWRDAAGPRASPTADGRRPPRELAAPAGGEWVVAVGPEGGFDAAELAAFGDAPRLAVGPYVLRAETAAIAVDRRARPGAGRLPIAHLSTSTAESGDRSVTQ